jgi:hypothetical protein
MYTEFFSYNMFWVEWSQMSLLNYFVIDNYIIIYLYFINYKNYWERDNGLVYICD